MPTIKYTDQEIADIRLFVSEGWPRRDIALAYGFPFTKEFVSKKGYKRRDPNSYFYRIANGDLRGDSGGS